MCSGVGRCDSRQRSIDCGRGQVDSMPSLDVSIPGSGTIWRGGTGCLSQRRAITVREGRLRGGEGGLLVCHLQSPAVIITE